VSRAYFVADVHLGPHRRYGGKTVVGVNDRCRHVLRALRRAKTLAVEGGASAFVVAGDLLDGVKPTPQLIAAVQDVLSDVPCVLLLGNHEQHSATLGDHSLAPLRPVASVVDVPTTVQLPGTPEVDLVCVPFRPGRASVWLPGAALEAAVSARPGSDRVLVVHLGIADDNTAFFLKGAEDSVTVDQVVEVARSVGARTVIAGNWHNARRWSVGGVDVVQVGTLCPVGYRDSGTDGRGGVAVYDAGEPGDGPWRAARGPSIELLSVPGPRFIQVTGSSTDVIDAVARAKARGADPLYVEATVPDAEVSLAHDVLDGLRSSVIEGFDVLAESGDEMSTAAAEAARAAAGGGDDPVQAWVDAMELPEDVERAEVIARVREMLKAG
jgi:DNA repair exonuclease SbcCD nuclease subunit